MSWVEAKVKTWGLTEIFLSYFYTQGQNQIQDTQSKILNSFSISCALIPKGLAYVTKIDGIKGWNDQIWGLSSAKLLLLSMLTHKHILQPQIDWGQKKGWGGLFLYQMIFTCLVLRRILEQPKLFCSSRTSQNYFSKYLSLFFCYFVILS